MLICYVTILLYITILAICMYRDCYLESIVRIEWKLNIAAQAICILPAQYRTAVWPRTVSKVLLSSGCVFFVQFSIYTVLICLTRSCYTILYRAFLYQATSVVAVFLMQELIPVVGPHIK